MAHASNHNSQETSMFTAQQGADEMLAAVGTNFSRGTTVGDQHAAIARVMGMYAEDNTGQYSTADCEFVLATIQAILSAPKRGEW